MSAESGACLNNRNRNDDIKCCEGTTIVILILVGCGIASLGLSAVIWFFYDIFNAPEVVTPEVVTSEVITTVPFTSTTTTTTQITTTSKPPSCDKRIVGFFSESDNREIKTMQLSKLTHAVFSHLEMSWEGELGFKSSAAKERFTDLKSKAKNLATDLKVMISIVGYFRQIAVDRVKKNTFIDSVIFNLQTYNVDGIDLQWERETFSQKHLNLLKELRQTLDKTGERYIISVTLPAPPNSGSSFDTKEILKHADFLNIISMKYHDFEGTRIAPISPLYSEDGGSLNVDATMKHLVCETKEPLRFNIVIPFFVRCWYNVKNSTESPILKFSSGRFIETLRDSVKESASWDHSSKSSFIYDKSNSTFHSLEDVKSIVAKLDYVNSKNLGGVWIWMVEMDEKDTSLLDTVNSDDFCSVGSEDNVNFDC